MVATLQKLNAKIFLFFLLFLFFSPSALLGSSTLEGVCVRVADGDTITIQTPEGEKKKIRFYGIDCPEKGQDFGSVARKFIVTKTLHKKVIIQVVGKDRYKRIIGLVWTADNPDETLQEQLLKEGLTWVYPQYCKEDFCRKWQSLEGKARHNKKGLWQKSDFEPPWKWRKRH